MKDKLLLFCIIVWSLVIGLVFQLATKFNSYNKPAKQIIEIEQTISSNSNIIEEIKLEEKDTLQLAINICKYKYSSEIADEVIKECNKYNLPIYVAYALMLTESEGNRNAKSSKNCRGLFQISEVCLVDYNNFHWDEQFIFDEIYDIEKNIKVGLWHYQRYRNRVNDDWVKLYAIYNNGYTGYLENGTANIKSAVDRFNFYLKKMEIYFN